MNHITNHITRAAARQSRKAAKQAITGCILLLSFPAADVLPIIEPALLPILALGIIALGLAVLSFLEVLRLERLKKRFNSPNCPPIQL